MPVSQFPRELSQHQLLPIRIVTPGFGHLNASMDNHGKAVLSIDGTSIGRPSLKGHSLLTDTPTLHGPGRIAYNKCRPHGSGRIPYDECSPHSSNSRRLPYYFLLFVLKGSVRLSVDLQETVIARNELLFTLPNQLQEFPEVTHSHDYFKLGFDDECLSRLPGNYLFLLNPLNLQQTKFSPAAAKRLAAVFGSIKGLLSDPASKPALILAYLHTLLSEIDSSYALVRKQPADEDLEKFVHFKLFVETNLSEQPPIADIAAKLSISTDTLCRIVKKYSDHSPREFFTNRLILEARRRIHLGQAKSVKELAYELGFTDPGYFSRVFKKATGKTVLATRQDLS